MEVFFNLLHFESESGNIFHLDNLELVLIPKLDFNPYYKKSIQLALKEGQFYTMTYFQIC